MSQTAKYRDLGMIGFPFLEINIQGILRNVLQKSIIQPVDTYGYELYDVNRGCRYYSTQYLVGVAWCFAPQKEYTDSQYASNIEIAASFECMTPRNKAPIQPTGQYWVIDQGIIIDTYNWRYVDEKEYAKIIDPFNMCPFDKMVAAHFVPIPTQLRLQGYTYLTLKVIHINGNRSDNHAYNLRWEDPTAPPVTQPTVKSEPEVVRTRTAITVETLRRIVRMLVSGCSNKRISRATGVSVENVNNIRKRNSPRYASIPQKWSIENDRSFDDLLASDEDIEAIVQAYKDGKDLKALIETFTWLTPAQIVIVLEDHTDWWAKYINKYNDKDNVVRDAAIQALLDSGMRQCDIQKLLMMTQGQVAGVTWRYAQKSC